MFVPGETVTLALSVQADHPVEDFVFGVGLFAADGTRVYGTNTDIEDFTVPRLDGDGEVRLALEELSLVEGTYLVDVAAHRRDGTPYDYHRGLTSFRVKSRVKDVGLYRPRHRWAFEGEHHPRGPRAAGRARPGRGARPPERRPRAPAPAILGEMGDTPPLSPSSPPSARLARTRVRASC